LGDNATKNNKMDASHDESGTRHPAESNTIMDGQRLLQSLRAAGAWLDRHVSAVNALNVFPVPDGDTGTNMSMTMRAALDELGDRSYAAVSDLGRALAQGALMGARGNSGVILSQILRGFARSMDDKQVLTPSDFARALEEGAATAYKGVMKPVEGTILTVIREAAKAAMQAAAMNADMEQVLESAVNEACASVERTPTLLPVLADAGVVDAGGQGLTLILEGILRAYRGESIEVQAAQSVAQARHEALDSEYNYDTQFVIQGHALDVDAIRDKIATMGDSVLVVGDEKTVKVHVHTDYPGQALDYGISQGRVTAVIIENMQEQYESFVGGSNASADDPSPEPSSVPAVALRPEPLGDVCVVAVVSGPGLERVFESLGVGSIVPGGQTMNPSTQDLVQAIEELPCDQVIVLPNNSNIILTARQAEDLCSKQVKVVPTRTVPQGIAALLAFNYQADLETNHELMLEASTQVQTGEVTRAVRSAQVNGLCIKAGQFIGLLNGDLVTAKEDMLSVVIDLLERMNATDYEIVTIYRGEDILPDEAEALAEQIRQIYSDLEIEVLEGGQAHYHYIISAE
jgi:DAK2 domain fusion protein YloV